MRKRGVHSGSSAPGLVCSLLLMSNETLSWLPKQAYDMFGTSAGHSVLRTTVRSPSVSLGFLLEDTDFSPFEGAKTCVLSRVAQATQGIDCSIPVWE